MSDAEPATDSARAGRMVGDAVGVELPDGALRSAIVDAGNHGLATSACRVGS